MTGYFASAGYIEDARPPYQNTALVRLKRWAYSGLIAGGVIEIIMFLVLLRVTEGDFELLVAFGDPGSAGWVWIGIGLVLLGMGIVCAVGAGVVKAVAYDQQFRFGPLPVTPVGAPVEERAPRLDDVSRHAGTDADPIPVTDNFIR